MAAMRTNAPRRERRGFVIMGRKAGDVAVILAATGDLVQTCMESVETARDWINAHECAYCGLLITDEPEAECQGRHFVVAPITAKVKKPFRF